MSDSSAQPADRLISCALVVGVICMAILIAGVVLVSVAR
jgi:hypothetical protein